MVYEQSRSENNGMMTDTNRVWTIHRTSNSSLYSCTFNFGKFCKIEELKVQGQRDDFVFILCILTGYRIR